MHKQTLICMTTKYSGADDKNKEVIKKYFCLLFIYTIFIFLRLIANSFDIIL